MKKLIAMVLAFTLVSSAFIGGTWAMELSEQNEAMKIASDNGITLRNHIEQEAVSPDGASNMVPIDGKLDKPVYPAVYSDDTPMDADTGIFFSSVNNVIDYYVSTALIQETGTASNDLYYVRTVFAFENTGNIVDNMYFSRNMNQEEVVWSGFEDNEKITIKIDNKEYRLFTCTYQNPISAGQKTPYSMRQFCFSKEITNEEFAFGTYEIKVQSQCVPQLELFGEISTINHPWLTS